MPLTPHNPAQSLVQAAQISVRWLAAPSGLSAGRRLVPNTVHASATNPPFGPEDSGRRAVGRCQEDQDRDSNLVAVHGVIGKNI